MRIPFGTTPATAEYTTISEAAIYFRNGILADVPWDATNLQSHHRHLISREEHIPSSHPLVKVKQLAVNIEAKEASMDGFIGDIISITIDNTFWVENTKNAVLLVINTMFRPL